MKAGSGFAMTTLVAALAAVPALAQSAPAGAPAPETQGETVGPRELRDFSLPGTTPPATQSQPQSEPPPERTNPAGQDRSAAPAARPSQRSAAERSSIAEPTETQPPVDTPQDLQSQPSEAATQTVPDGSFVSQPSVDPVAIPPAAQTPVAESKWGMVPWLMAALLAALAAAYAVWRRRSRAALAGMEDLEAFVPAEPRPPMHPRLPPAAGGRAPAPPSTPPNAASKSGGIVSTRLRPSLELELTPGRCVIDEQQATIEFTITAMNSGNAPARDVRIEVALINAGPAQDQEIARFFQQPAGVGEPLEVIPPMRSIQLHSRVSMPLDQVRAFEAAGRKLFVPLLAFNALFRWSGGEGQRSLSYLVGREGDAEKMAPFRLDIGPRIFRKLGARPHHMRVQR